MKPQTLRIVRLGTTALLAAAVTACALPRGSHALTVFDPANYQQNLATALRSLEQINNQVRQLQSQAKMLLRMDRNLATLPGNVAPQLQGVLTRLERQIASGNAIALDVSATDQALRRLYPQAVDRTETQDQRIANTQARWREAHASFLRATRLQADIMSAIVADRPLLDQLMQRSRASLGALQATQAGNELAALSIKQAMQLQSLHAVEARALAMDRARTLQGEAEARARFEQFLTQSPAYTPTN